MTKEYIADKATLDNVNSIVSAFNNRWPDARAGKVDNIQAVLNTPNGDTLAAWLQSIANSAANAYNKANEANNNAANAANLASQANSNAWNAYQEAINAKNAANNAGFRSAREYGKNQGNGNKGTIVNVTGRGKVWVCFRTGGEVIIDGKKMNSSGDGVGSIYENNLLQPVEFEFRESAMIVATSNNTVYAEYVLYE